VSRYSLLATHHSLLTHQNSILIAAQSGRALAAAARRAGLRAYVADLFGDTDTRRLAAAHRLLDGRFGRGIAAAPALAALEALDGLARRAGPAPIGVVLGSGFEARPGLVEAIDRRFGLIGASAQCVRRLKDPLAFAALTADLGVPHPAVRLDAVADPSGFLSKRRGGCGGGHIRPATAAPPGTGRYLQARVAGQARSIAFLADGANALILAVSEQWAAPSPRSPWRYGGAAAPASLPPPVARQAARAIAGIVAAVGLRGLASADLLVDGETWWLLEINPRPGATLDLLDCRPTPLMRRHIEAARGHLGPAEAPADGAIAAKIIYAAQNMRIGPILPLMRDALPWSAYVMDRPPPGSLIRAGAPICTVTAAAADLDSAKALLETRHARIQQFLAGFGAGPRRGRAEAVAAPGQR
jgi:uncharacterized protein